MAKANVPNKNLTLVYQSIEPNLELKLFVSSQLMYLLEKCPNHSNLTAKIADLQDRFLVQLNLTTEKDLLFASGEDEVIAGALDGAITDLADQMKYWNKHRADEVVLDYEQF
jgi:ribosome-associated translation inhibitor RaiA